MDDLKPAVMSTKTAHRYVGGKPFFDQLLAKFPDLLTPVRECKPTSPKAAGKREYLTEDIDRALRAAKMSQSFIQPK